MRALLPILVGLIGILNAWAFTAGRAALDGRCLLGRNDVVFGFVSTGLVVVSAMLYGVALYGERD